MAVGSLVTSVKENSRKYLDSFKPFLLEGLRAADAHQLCQVSVGVVSDLCRALGAELSGHCDEIVQILLQNLQVNLGC